MTIRTLVAAMIAFAALGLGSATAQSADPLASGKIAEAVVFDGKLWLRGALENPQTGSLVSVDLASGARTVHFDKGVIDIDATDGHLWVVRQATEAARNFNIQEWQDGAFADVTSTGAGVPQPIAMIAAPRSIVLLTPVSIHTFDKSLKRWGGIRLKGGLRYGVTFSVAMPKGDNVIYFGANPLPASGGPREGAAHTTVNNGQLNGVLQRIDLSTGSVADIQKLRTANPCDGPLSSECSTITAIVADTVHSGCVIVALGFQRGEDSDGRVLRVCRDDVSIVLEQKAANQPAGAPIVLSEPIWGLAATADGFWAVGQSGLYRFTGDAHTDSPLPAPAPYGGTPLGRGVAGAIVLPTAVTSAQSVSGYHALVVATEAAAP